MVRSAVVLATVGALASGALLIGGLDALVGPRGARVTTGAAAAGGTHVPATDAQAQVAAAGGTRGPATDAQAEAAAAGATYVPPTEEQAEAAAAAGLGGAPPQSANAPSHPSKAMPSRPSTSAAAGPPVPSRRGQVVVPAYVVAPGDLAQRQIDACRLALWSERPLWLAGHNWCGYAWFARLTRGSRVVVPSGPAAGRYTVTGRMFVRGPLTATPAVDADLVLQTCVVGGTSFTLLRRVR